MSTTETAIDRALGEAMHVRPYAPGMATILSESGEGYIVDFETETCSCPANEYSDDGEPCKHTERARLESVLGEENGLPTFDDSDHPLTHGELL